MASPSRVTLTKLRPYFSMQTFFCSLTSRYLASVCVQSTFQYWAWARS